MTPKIDLSRKEEAMAYLFCIRGRARAVLFFVITFVSLIFLYLDPPEDAAEYKKRLFLIVLVFSLALLCSSSFKEFKKFWRK